MPEGDVGVRGICEEKKEGKEKPHPAEQLPDGDGDGAAVWLLHFHTRIPAPLTSILSAIDYDWG